MPADGERDPVPAPSCNRYEQSNEMSSEQLEKQRPFKP